MPIPTKEEAEEFIYKNRSFFSTPLTIKGQKTFQQFYADANAIDKIEDYSQKLMILLNKYNQRLNNGSSRPVIYAWKKGNFSPALKHNKIRQFIIDNKNHDAITIWMNANSVEALNTPKNQTPKQENLLRNSNHAKNLEELETECLKMDRKQFDFLFDTTNDPSMSFRDEYIRSSLIQNDISGTLFEAKDDYDNWKTEIVLEKNRQIQTQEIILPPTEKATKIIEGLINSVRSFCSSIDNFASSLVHTNQNDGAPKP